LQSVPQILKLLSPKLVYVCDTMHVLSDCPVSIMLWHWVCVSVTRRYCTDEQFELVFGKYVSKQSIAVCICADSKGATSHVAPVPLKGLG